MAPRTINQVEFGCQTASITPDPAQNSAVGTSTIAAWPSCQVTAAIRPSDAAATPSTMPVVILDPRKRLISGCVIATNTNPGAKIAIVARIAPDHPFSRKPIKVAVVNTGPGVN